MATGILLLLDDIALVLDDAATMSKVAAKKTVGLLGDDLAVNAEKATGFHASRELPVIWAITKGSFINKLIILPIAFLLSAFAPWLIVPILLLGGVYLSYEGAEKVWEWFAGHEKTSLPAKVSDKAQSSVATEKSKIRAAVRTDFILSIEIIVVTLGTVMAQSLLLQIVVVSLIGFAATIGVYGLVALLVRMDDTGLYLVESMQGEPGLPAKLVRASGHGLVAALPWVIRGLGIVGTIAMLLVGGGMFVHNLEAVHHALQFLPGISAELVAGLIVGALAMLGMKLVHMVRGQEA